jgi:hypothetical protein
VINIMQQLAAIAAVNPRLAVAILQSQAKYPQLLTLTFDFESGAAEQPVPAQFDSPVTSDFWVYDISYQVQQPLLAPGSLLRGQQVFYNALNPNIDLTLQVTGGVSLPWEFAPSPQPVEALCRPMTGPGSERKYGCCDSFVMFFPQTVKGTAYFTREYLDQEMPTRLIVGFSGLVLGCKNYGGLTDAQARQILNTEYRDQFPAVRVPVPERG